MRAMGEPTSAAGSALLVKWLGGLPLVAAVAAGVVVMVMTPGKTPREFLSKLMVTITTSIVVSPSVIAYFQFGAWPQEAQNGIVFLTGLPSWILFSIVFGMLERMRGKSAAEIAEEIRKLRS